MNDGALEWTLIRCSFTRELNDEEKKSLNAWLNESPAHQAFYDRISSFHSEGKDFGLSAEQYEQDFMRYVSLVRQVEKRRKMRGLAYVARFAAVFVIFLAVGAYLWYRGAPISATREVPLTFVSRGKMQPILITGEGMRIMLDEQGDSLSRILDGRVASGKNGIVYNSVAQETSLAVVGEHTLVVPRGGEYRVELADGTVVWLNSESELRYPVCFTDSIREVTLKGEAYLEVAKDAKPFKVWVEDVVVKVYGTHFNVNGYAKERVQVVLLDGSVGVSSLRNPDVEQMIVPNEMAEVVVSTGKCSVKMVDAAAYAAWKDGYFSFEYETLEQIMEKLSRWYDIRVTFKNDEARVYRFSGRVGRDESFQGVLNLLERTLLVKFDVDGNEITIN